MERIQVRGNNDRGDVAIEFKMQYRCCTEMQFEDDIKSENDQQSPVDTPNWNELSFSEVIPSPFTISKDGEITVTRFDMDQMDGFYVTMTQFEFKLMGRIKEIASGFIEIDAGSFSVDFDCVVDSDYIITEYPANRDFYCFRSL